MSLWGSEDLRKFRGFLWRRRTPPGVVPGVSRSASALHTLGRCCWPTRSGGRRGTGPIHRAGGSISYYCSQNKQLWFGARPRTLAQHGRA